LRADPKVGKVERIFLNKRIKIKREGVYLGVLAFTASSPNIVASHTSSLGIDHSGRDTPRPLRLYCFQKNSMEVWADYVVEKDPEEIDERCIRLKLQGIIKAHGC
jgi:hypothetical protein